jgi:tricorn protease
MQGYYRQPAIHGDNIAFISEDDLWIVSQQGGKAIRLTASPGIVSAPRFSEDGKWIAYTCNEEGSFDIYVIPSTGGESKRLTWLNATASPMAWRKGKVIFTSAYKQPFMRTLALFEVDLEGHVPELLPYGNATHISFGSKGAVLGINTGEPARWKRYRGGTAGRLLIDKDGKGQFKPLFKMKGNFTSPMWIGNRIYFISDHEGIGNIYSCNPDGKDIKKHSNHKDYYARRADTDGKSIVWHAGADIYCLDLKTDKVKKVNMEYASPFAQRQRKFVDASKYLESAELSKDGGSLAIAARGKAFSLGNWEGSVQQYGIKHGVRYRQATYLPDGKSLALISDEGDKERLEIHPVRKDFVEPGKDKVKVFDKIGIGRVYSLKTSPVGNLLALSNHRNELIVYNYETGKAQTVDQNKFGLLNEFDWSPDGRWLAYAIEINRKLKLIRIYDTQKKKIHDVTKPVFADYSPCFDPAGKYLYFLSQRTFEPVMDTVQFDFIFPNSVKPYLIPLKADTRSPFEPDIKGFENKPDEAAKKDEEKAKEDKKNAAKNIQTAKQEEPPKPVEIDFDDIAERIIEFPVPNGIYESLSAAENRIFYLSIPGIVWNNDEAKLGLECYDINKLEGWTYLNGINGYSLSGDHNAALVFINKRLRVVSTKLEPKAVLPAEDAPGRKSGWIDLNRIKLEIEPLPEWQQMFREAWRLQKYHFWTEDMSGIDWQKVFKRYYPLVSRCGCRSEFSDLMWEMQGELGTSHCYEFGGDYRQSPSYRIGQLGIDYKYNAKRKAWEITKILKGWHWSTENRSPLMNPGLGIKPGWLITAINGQPLSQDITPEKVTVNLAGQLVQLSMMSPNGKVKKNVTVKTMQHEAWARYSDWVETNRDYVHQKSKGKVGYIHIPDCGQTGLIMFHRMFLAEVDYDGLVVDVRFNGGGSVSGLLLQKLARRRIGYDLTRWWGANPYPNDAPMGAMVMLTNEDAGSDGDIISHSFKLMKLGKLIGMRTWGGVIGIWPRHWLADGTVTTQPEFSFWFKDVGWGVENYGTDPDIEVDILPQDYVKGIDPQLDTSIAEVLSELKKNPPLKPDFSKKPQLPLP